MTRKSLKEYFSNFEDQQQGERERSDAGAGSETAGLIIANNNNNNSGSSSSSSSSDSRNATKAWVSLKIPNLKQLVAKRASVLTKLEHAINVEDVLGKIPITRDETTTAGGTGGRGLDITVVDLLFKELKEFNTEITASIERIERRAALDNPYDYNMDK